MPRQPCLGIPGSHLLQHSSWRLVELPVPSAPLLFIDWWCRALARYKSFSILSGFWLADMAHRNAFSAGHAVPGAAYIGLELALSLSPQVHCKQQELNIPFFRPLLLQTSAAASPAWMNCMLLGIMACKAGHIEDGRKPCPPACRRTGVQYFRTCTLAADLHHTLEPPAVCAVGSEMSPNSLFWPLHWSTPG